MAYFVPFLARVSGLSRASPIGKRLLQEEARWWGNRGPFSGVFRGPISGHLLGLLGGGIWGPGDGVPQSRGGPSLRGWPISYALGQFPRPPMWRPLLGGRAGGGRNFEGAWEAKKPGCYWGFDVRVLTCRRDFLAGRRKRTGNDFRPALQRTLSGTGSQ